MKLDQRQLIQDVKTRWNSMYFMIERLVEQRWPITADTTATKSSDRYLDLKSHQWELLEALKFYCTLSKLRPLFSAKNLMFRL